jgi:uncharacterized protein (DUF2126 family)
MSVAQQLVRALIARFWGDAVPRALVRWGTAIHDRFLLPHFVWQDFRDVVDETGRAGFRLDPDWFLPHFGSASPRSGRVVHDGVRLRARTALEPWHVLGEEPGAGGTVRYVDSSVERLQVEGDELRPRAPRRHLQRGDGAAASDRHRGSTSPRSAIVRGGPRRACTRRSRYMRPSRSTWSTAGSGARSAGARITLRTPVGATMRPSP